LVERVHARSTAREPDGELRYRLRCIDKVGHRFRGDERLLDAGCGDGGVARLLRERVGSIVAVDIEPSPEWRDEPGLEFLVANAEQLPFEDDTFDVVHSKDSLHHMESPERALAEYRRVLRPRGVALIVEANRYNPSFFLHMTRALGHEHFTAKRFRGLVAGRFGGARFGSFEAHYVPRARRLLRVQQLVEDTIERAPVLHPLLAYNFAVVQLPA
jgi:ubiquinone/menaquinone biosynthesis C-methylase UbiE